MDIAPVFVPSTEPVAELDRLGDEIAVLSAHLEAATARLLGLSASSTRVAAGTPASAPAPSGSLPGTAQHGRERRCLPG